MECDLLLTGIDAAKALSRAPYHDGFDGEPLLFLFGDIDPALFRCADESKYAPGFICLKLCVDLALSYLGILGYVHHILADRRTRDMLLLNQQ
jgi:hypothetical protein